MMLKLKQWNNGIAEFYFMDKWGKCGITNETELDDAPTPDKQMTENQMLRELGKCPETRKQIYSLLEKSDSRIKYFLPIKKGNGKITQDMIDRAKEYPIGSITEVHGEKILCQWHADTQPSMKVYEKTNTSYCYACNKFADSIDIYSKLNNCDFKTAVRELAK